MKRESKGQGVGGLAGERENSEGAVGARVGFRVELEVLLRNPVWCDPRAIRVRSACDPMRFGAILSHKGMNFSCDPVRPLCLCIILIVDAQILGPRPG